MRTTVTVAIVFSIWGGSTLVASAQPALKRLEDLIRSERLGTPGGPAVPAPPPPPEPRAEVDGNTEPAPAADVPAKEAAERGYLGLVADDRDDGGRGIRALEVLPGGPADKAGLRANDLIIGLGGAPVREMSEMATILKEVPVGGRITFEVLRGIQRREIEVTLGRRPPPGERRFKIFAPSPPTETAKAPSETSPPTPPAEVAPAPSEDARIAALEQRIVQLEQRVAELERLLAQADGAGQQGERRQQAVPVRFTVIYQGAPVAEAAVTLVPRDPGGKPAAGQTGPDGEAKLTTYEADDGALPGRYTVTIVKLTEAEPPKNLLPERFARPETSGLEAEVQADGPNQFRLEVGD
ncbi:MAG: PDZ domain-containing protein [Planctomycetota bacterium]